MPYPTTVFKELIERYPTWPELECVLESEEGGWFRIIEGEGDLCIIRYEKGISNMNLPYSKWFRSVVWNRRTHLPVSVAPPKACNEPMLSDGIYQEWLDGFMINAFRVAGDPTLHLSTRSCLDASGHFYSSRPFRELFMEACTGKDVDAWNEQSIPAPHEIETARFYSFLVQHTEHRIVTDHLINRVYVIQKGTVYPDGTVVIEDDPSLPPYHSIPTYTIENVPLYLQTQPWSVQGLVCKDGKGNRWRIRNEKYEVVRSLRGTTSCTVNRFAQLYTQHMMHHYLTFYPSDAILFAHYQEKLHHIIECLYYEYQYLHVLKTRHIHVIEKMYHPHLYALHGFYLTVLRPRPLAIHDIQEYVRKLPWQRIAFLIRKIG